SHAGCPRTTSVAAGNRRGGTRGLSSWRVVDLHRAYLCAPQPTGHGGGPIRRGGERALARHRAGTTAPGGASGLGAEEGRGRVALRAPRGQPRAGGLPAPLGLGIDGLARLHLPRSRPEPDGTIPRSLA